MQKKIVITWTVACLIISVAVCYVSSAYPFIRHVKAAPVAIQGNVVTIKGTLDVYFTKDAWEEIKYKNGNFHNFDNWWHTQIGQRYTYMGVTAKLEYIDFTLQQHYPDHDRLGFVLKIKILDY